MTSPNNNTLWSILDNEKSAFRWDLKAVVIDKAHCVQAWGGIAVNGNAPFRKEYANIGGLQAFHPASVPFLAMWAILPRRLLQYIQCSLGLVKNTVLIKLHFD
ncbi:hypothetical protein K440DRAFT_551443 [Wilcoxina mikolae CBS 423.85]|nr:hypothetical protein K440DRAFT_551443 [Wilcoxina mikolae CBS 423.85]